MASQDNGAPRPQVPRLWPGAQVLSGGIASVLAWGLLAGVHSLTGFDVASYVAPYTAVIMPGADPQALLGMAIGWGLSIGVPLMRPQWQDVYRRLNADVVAAAIVDPAKPGVSLEKVTNSVPPGTK